MKVLVTGGCGFIGSHVCEYYAKKGGEVVSFDNLTKHELARTGYATDAARTYNLDFLRSIGVTNTKGDIRNLDELTKAASGCDFIIHTAAQPAMTISVEDPRLDFSTNVQGTFNVLETARKHDIPIVSCSTIHVYGNRINETLREGKTRYLRTPPAIDEEHTTLEGTVTPLHASKRAAELYVQTFIDSYGLRAASYRLTGLYGPRQFGGEDHGWVANFSIRIITGKPLTIYGTGKQVRDILYASDVAEAFHAFYKNQKPGIYNVGGGESHMISLIECIRLIEKITGKTAAINYGPDRLGDLRYFVCDIAKARRELNWTPKIPPERGVKLLTDWIQKNERLFRGGPA
jgi:CDP-paratose 2-epimerase